MTSGSTGSAAKVAKNAAASSTKTTAAAMMIPLMGSDLIVVPSSQVPIVQASSSNGRCRPQLREPVAGCGQGTPDGGDERAAALLTDTVRLTDQALAPCVLEVLLLYPARQHLEQQRTP